MSTQVSRRTVMVGAASASALQLLARFLPAGAAQTELPFDSSVVRGLARGLAQKPYQTPTFKLPDEIAGLNYDQYRSIRFDPKRALWSEDKRNFRVEFFHLGFLYKNPVNIFVVENGRASLFPYSHEEFIFGLVAPPKSG